MQRSWGWWLGAFIAAFSIIFYIISRTVGMPGTEVEEFGAFRIASLVVEGAFVLIALSVISRLRKS